MQCSVMKSSLKTCLDLVPEMITQSTFPDDELGKIKEMIVGTVRQRLDDASQLAAAHVQNLLWGLGQPFAGAVADRFGLFRVMCVGAVLYAGGLFLMRYSTTPLSLNIGAGVMVGFGLAGCSFNLVLSAFSKPC